MATESPPTPPAINFSQALRKSGIRAAVLFIMDAFVFTQGVIALCTLLAAGVFVLGALASRKHKERMKLRFAKAALYGIAALAVFGVLSLNNTLAASRAETVIAACNQYKAKHQKFPEDLTALVPEFLPEIPRAKMAFFHNSFIYFSSEASAPTAYHQLVYVAVPPFGRRVYSLEKASWGTLD